MKQSTKYLKIACNLMTAVFFLFLLIYVAPRVIIYFMPFVIGFVFSLIANPIVKFLEKRIKIKRKYGSMIIIILVIALVVCACYGIGALLISGIRNFSASIPQMSVSAEQELQNALYQLQNLINKIPFINDVDFSSIGSSIAEFISDFVSGVNGTETVSTITDIAKSIPNILVNVVVGLLATYFFIADREKLSNFVVKNLPESFRKRVGAIYQQTLGVVGGYFKAQFKIMGVIYVVLFIGLLLLRVDYAWLIGFGIAFLDMLPVFGTGTILCPWAVIKLFSGNFEMAIGMIILYIVTLVVHQVIQPKLVGETIGMNPFLALFFMYIGYQISSVVGMIIAVPFGMILINLYKAGAFDNLIWCVREVVGDFNRFRRIREKEEE